MKNMEHEKANLAAQTSWSNANDQPGRRLRLPDAFKESKHPQTVLWEQGLKRLRYQIQRQQRASNEDNKQQRAAEISEKNKSKAETKYKKRQERPRKNAVPSPQPLLEGK